MVAQVSWQQASQGCISVKDNKKKSLVSIFYYILGLPGWRGRESACQCRRHKRFGFDPWVQKTPQSRKLEPVPIFLPGKFHGQRILVGYSSWGHKESDMTEQLSTQTYHLPGTVGSQERQICIKYKTPHPRVAHRLKLGRFSFPKRSPWCATF